MYKDIYKVKKRLEQEFGFKLRKSKRAFRNIKGNKDLIAFRKVKRKWGVKFVFCVFTRYYLDEPSRSNIHCDLYIDESKISVSGRYEELFSMVELERFIKMAKYDYFDYYKRSK